MKKRLTETNVRTLPLKPKRYHCWDFGTDAAQGLGVLVSPNGIRTYRAVYYYPSSRKAFAMKLGRVGEMSLEEARDKTREIRGLARKGHDPRKGDPARSDNFKTTIEIWTEKEQIGRKQARSALETQSFVLNACKGWHGRPVGAIMYHEIEELLFVKRDIAPYSANRLHGALATFFRWCLRTHRITVNPMAAMPKPWEGATTRKRDWFKGDAADEVVRNLWKFADKLGGDDELFLKLLIITGKRKGAIKGMAWEQISNDWFWTPPPGSKTKRNHAIPLPTLAQTVLGKHQKSGSVIHRVDRNLQGKIRKALKLDDFIFHGLRHIVETRLGDLKVPWYVRDMLLDHAPLRGAGRGYDHGNNRDVMAEALETWCGHITKLVQSKPRRL